MQSNFCFINNLFIIETDHEVTDNTELKPNTGKVYHVDTDDGEIPRPETSKYLEDIISNIKSNISLKYELLNISKNDVEEDAVSFMDCGTEVICEFLCTNTVGGKYKRKYAIQLVLRSGYYCCYNLDFNVIQYDDNNNLINVNRNIRFKSKNVIEIINSAIKQVREIYGVHAREAYIETIMSNGETCYAYVEP